MAQAGPFIHSCPCAHCKHLVKCYVPDGAMDALGNPSQLFPPPPLGTHHSWMVKHSLSYLGIQGTRSSNPQPSHRTSHWVQRHPSIGPCSSLSKCWFFPSVSPHPLLAGRASITTVRLEVIEAGDEERAHILSREAGKKKCSKDKHPVELREVNSRREPRFPPFPGVSIIPLRFNMHSDYFY